MKKGLVLAAALLGATGFCFGQEPYRVAKGHTLLGHGRITRKLTETGGMFTQMVMDFKKDGKLVEVTTETTIDPTGAFVREVETVTPDGKPPEEQFVVNYDSSGAHVVLKQHAVPTKTDVAPLPELSPGDPSELWFIKTQPKVGDSCKFQVFSPEKMNWEPGETTYVSTTQGRHVIKTTIGDRTIDTVLDDTGYIIRLTDSSGFRLVRDR